MLTKQLARTQNARTSIYNAETAYDVHNAIREAELNGLTLVENISNGMANYTRSLNAE